ncbi:MAG: hypothetical protein JNM85_06110 [Chthonomonas sp.]|nr:hypothetical protein [Chthonomonas sp.]
MLATLIAFTALCAPMVQDTSPNESLFAKFIENRVGAGEPVYWYCIGELYRYPEGELIARVEGVDTARLEPSSLSATTATQLSRKVFFYLDPITGAVITERNGQAVKPIEYPYQLIRYRLADGKLIAEVEQGSGARLQKVSANKTRVRVVGDTTFFSIPLFVSVETPRGRIEAYENYDFVVGAGAKDRVLTWNRFSDLPPAFGTGKSVFQLVARRFDKFTDLPRGFQARIRAIAPLWQNPPKDLNEIRELQK